MIASHPSLGAQKRDLHVGGLGSSAPAAAALVDPMIEAAGSWAHKGKVAARTADGLVRTNPWAAVAVIALLGLAAGYLLSQRTRA